MEPPADQSAREEARRRAIDQAMQAVRDAAPVAQQDPERPAYHFHPPAQWMNDPNGTIYYGGYFHLFYQHNPYGSEWGHMHWGHARSKDLLRWEHLPIALWPSKERGEKHVFSGGAALGPSGRPVLFYTSIGVADRAPEQWMARPVDDELIEWEKHPANPILSVGIHGEESVYEWRDPYLLQECGRTFMVVGGSLDPSGGHGAVFLYQASHERLEQWDYRGALFRHPDRAVRNIECPNFFKLDGRWVLIVSPNSQPEYFVGDFDPDAGRFTAETHGLVDGGSLYATNIITDRYGRTILLGWINTRRPAEAGWNGVLGLPRALSIGPDNHLRQHPIRALECLRSEFHTLGDLPVTIELPAEDPTHLLFVPAGEMPASFETQAADIPGPYGEKPGPRPTFGPQLEIHATLQALQAQAVGMALTGTDGHVRAALAYSAHDGMLCLNNRNMFAGIGRTLDVRIFVDRGVVELFDGEGHAPIACPVTGLSEGLQIHALSWGGAAAVTNVRVAEMRQP